MFKLFSHTTKAIEIEPKLEDIKHVDPRVFERSEAEEELILQRCRDVIAEMPVLPAPSTLQRATIPTIEKKEITAEPKESAEKEKKIREKSEWKRTCCYAANCQKSRCIKNEKMLQRKPFTTKPCRNRYSVGYRDKCKTYKQHMKK